MPARPSCYEWCVTLTQLEAFVLVARLGSVKAAARALGVSEPAVSGALAALRKHLGDPLITPSSHGMALSGGGQRLVGIASQMINLAAEAEAAIRSAQGAPQRLRVAATSTVAEFVAPPLIEAFTTRTPLVETTVGVSSSEEMAALLHERLADVCLGPRLSGERAVGIQSEPIMRYRLIVVASPSHRMAGGGTDPVPWRLLADDAWLVDPSAADPHSEVGTLLRQLRVPDHRVRVFASQAGALAAAAAGEGVAPAISHLVTREIERGALTRLLVASTPIELLWYVSTLGVDRRSSATSALRRFLGTPEAMQAMHRSDGGVPASRFRPPVYVTLWS